MKERKILLLKIGIVMLILIPFSVELIWRAIDLIFFEGWYLERNIPRWFLIMCGSMVGSFLGAFCPEKDYVKLRDSYEMILYFSLIFVIPAFVLILFNPRSVTF